MSSPLRRLAGSGGLYVVGTIAPILVLLAITPLVTRLLGAEEYGQVALAVSVYQFASVLLAGGLPIVVTRAALATESGFGGASGLVAVGSAVAVVVGVLVGLTCPLWVPLVFPGVAPSVIAAAALAGTGLAVVTLAQALLRAAEHVLRFVAFGVSAALLGPVVGLVLVLTTERTAELYSWGLAIGYGMVALAALVSSALLASPKVNSSAILEGYRVGLPTVPHSVSVPLLLTLAMTVVINSSGLALAGQLQVAAMLGSAIITIMNAVNNAWVPMIFKASDVDRVRLLADSTFGISLALLGLISGFVLVIPWLISFIGGPVIHGPGPAHVASLIATSSVFHLLYLANIHLTFLSGRTGPLAILTPLSAATAIGVLVLFSRIGPASTSAAFGLVWIIFYALQALFSYVLARRGPYPPADLRWALLPLSLAGLMGVQSAVVDPQPLWSAICLAPVAIMALVGVAMWSRWRYPV